MKPEEPATLLERQKAEVAALRKNQKAERDILNIIGKLSPEDAYRIMARHTASIARIVGSAVVEAEAAVKS